jgi:hypothetical protein
VDIEYREPEKDLMAFCVEEAPLTPVEIRALPSKVRAGMKRENKDFHQYWVSSNPGEYYTSRYVVPLPHDVILGMFDFIVALVSFLIFRIFV